MIVCSDITDLLTLGLIGNASSQALRSAMMCAVVLHCEAELLGDLAECAHLRLDGEGAFLCLARERGFLARLNNYLPGLARMIDANVSNRVFGGRRKSDLTRRIIRWNLIWDKPCRIRFAGRRPMGVFWIAIEQENAIVHVHRSRRRVKPCWCTCFNFYFE